jgi:hypothetical protein
MTDSRREMPMNEDLARRVLASEFHPTSGFSKDDPTLIAAKNYIAGLEAERTRSLALVRESKKVVAWLKALAGFAESRAKDKRFLSLSEANAADAKNYRATAKHLEASLLPYQNQQPGSKESGA